MRCVKFVEQLPYLFIYGSAFCYTCANVYGIMDQESFKSVYAFTYSQLMISQSRSLSQTADISK